MSEEWPGPGQECISHYYYISVQAFNLITEQGNAQKMLLAWPSCAEQPDT